MLGAQRGLDGSIWARAFLIVCVICWMKGAFFVPIASAMNARCRRARWRLARVASGVYFIGEKFAFAKVSNAEFAIWPATGRPFTPERLQTELTQGHTVFVDFTAAWCLTCKFNEASVLESAAVREAFQRHGIIKLKSRLDKRRPVITKLLQQFGRPGVPLYVLYPAKNEE